MKDKMVPRLRFPEFREAGEWEGVQLRELGQLVSGLTYTPDDVREDGLLVLRSSNIQNGVIVLDDCVYVTPEIKGANPTMPNDILICVRNGSKNLIGKNALIPKGLPRCTHGAFMTVFRSKSPQFVHQLFQTDSYYTQVSSDLGATINSINGSQFIKYKFFVPNPKEQQKIADCLSSLDDLITAHSQKLDALKAYKKGLMQQLFPAEGETVPRLRFLEFREAGEWAETSISDLVKANILFPPKDGNHGNIHPKSSDYVKVGIPFIMANDLKNGTINLSKCNYIRKEQADRLQKGFAKEGDVLITHKGTVGEVALIAGIEFPYLMLTPQVTYYRIKDKSKLSNKFLASLFTSEDFQRTLKAAAGGGTRSYLGIMEQEKLTIKFPTDLPEQQKIADCLSSLDDLIAAQSHKLEALKAHKKGLMQQLFPKPNNKKHI